MIKYFCALFCALLVLSLLDPIQCGKFSSRGSSRGSHSYPSSHSGLSGGSRHSGGLSGGSHGYPSSSGSRHTYPSSSGSHSYPSSGGSHGYPSSSTGLSGGGSSYPSSGSRHTYPTSNGNKHTYPSSSGGHSYPSSGNGLSGSGHSTNVRYPSRPHTTTKIVTHHYHYSPPASIVYAPPGYRSVSYPVYRGSPPTYVYEYRNSGSRYSTLLAGLALFNLGALAGTAYGHSRNHQTYKTQPGESCRLGIKRANGDYEETIIDCMLMSSFIYEEEAKAAGTAGATGTNSTTVTTTVTNTTVVNMTNPAPVPAIPTQMPPTTTPPPQAMPPLYQMLPNGTLVPVNMTVPVSANATVPSVNASSPTGANSTMTSSVVTTTTTNTTVVNALSVKGLPMQVTPTMDCFLIRTTPTSRMKKHIPCGVLNSYATQSLKRSSAARSVPTFTILFAIAAFVLY